MYCMNPGALNAAAGWITLVLILPISFIVSKWGDMSDQDIQVMFLAVGFVGLGFLLGGMWQKLEQIAELLETSQNK